MKIWLFSEVVWLQKCCLVFCPCLSIFESLDEFWPSLTSTLPFLRVEITHLPISEYGNVDDA